MKQERHGYQIYKNFTSLPFFAGRVTIAGNGPGWGWRRYGNRLMGRHSRKAAWCGTIPEMTQGRIQTKTRGLEDNHLVIGITSGGIGAFWCNLEVKLTCLHP